jgi:hypothetical protein
MAIKTFVLENYPEKEKRHSVIEKTSGVLDENIQCSIRERESLYKSAGKEKYISVTQR